jgi:hypothetical protein
MVQSTNRFWYKVQIDFGTRYKSILVQGTNRFWYKVQIDFGTRYKSILGQGTNRFWYKVQIDFGTRYKSILVQGTNRFWYKVQKMFSFFLEACIWSYRPKDQRSETFTKSRSRYGQIHAPKSEKHCTIVLSILKSERERFPLFVPKR